jgi:hypothetical protein
LVILSAAKNLKFSEPPLIKAADSDGKLYSAKIPA